MNQAHTSNAIHNHIQYNILSAEGVQKSLTAIQQLRDATYNNKGEEATNLATADVRATTRQ